MLPFYVTVYISPIFKQQNRTSQKIPTEKKTILYSCFNMSEEFDIFKNLDDLRKLNPQAILKSLERANHSNGDDDVPNIDDSFNDDFDSFINNNIIDKSPPKRPKKVNVTKDVAPVPDKATETKKTRNRRRSSTSSSNLSWSSTVDLLDKNDDNEQMESIAKTRRKRNATGNSVCSQVVEANIAHNNNIKKQPVADSFPVSDFMSMPVRPSRKSFDAIRKMAEEQAAAAAAAEAREKNTNTTAKATRARGKGRGRGRGRTNARARKTNEDSFISGDDSSHNSEVSSESESNDSDVSDEEPQVEQNNPTTSSASIMERFLDQARGRGRRRGRGRGQATTQSRRSHVAEIAARAPQVGFVDLVSSPLPHIEGTIVIGSDGEDEGPRTRRKNAANNLKKSKKNQNIEKNPCLDISLDDDNPELSIKVKWKGIPEAFKLRKYQKFSLIFQQLAEREGTDLGNIAFNISSRIITPEDTPDSIDYKIYQFIDGRVITALNSPMGAAAPKKQRDQNKITVKIQSDKWKRPLQIDLQKTDKFRILYIKCSEELSVNIDRLKLSFDGDLLELNDTPADLDLEGGEVIDLRFRD
ncbi:uncharacterized protein LOC142222057 [Haematobia irritans]|uniref:uncharacterized protein LOC142222057 n=1 Tax=Haematobia irritans TaxID=7368 RepID=UPI003F50892F